MKRIGCLYDKIYDIENLRLAHKNARKGKGWYKEVNIIDNNTDEYLYKLQRMLINKTYKTSEYEKFTKIDKGKEREIYKLPYFPDRVCQWAIMQIIEPYLIKKLTADTYSAIKGRGIHKAHKKLKKSLKNDERGTKYFLKIDIKKYYSNINQDIMINEFKNIFKDNDLIWLLSEIIKSTDSGVPIGNYVSQWCGNLYLSKFDHWIKEVMRVKYYFRYMDDCVFISDDKKFLNHLKMDIEWYLKCNLNLELKYNWQISPVESRGIDFVGYRTFHKYSLLRKSIYVNLRRKRKLLNKNTIASYNGWLKHGNCYNLSNKYFKSEVV